VLNLKVGNVPEAAAFFRLLRERYQGDPNVPLTYYYWGDYNFNKGDYQKPPTNSSIWCRSTADSKFVRDASLGLARALRHLGYDKQAFQIVDYIEKRWPRFYVEFPPCPAPVVAMLPTPSKTMKRQERLLDLLQHRPQGRRGRHHPGASGRPSTCAPSARRGPRDVRQGRGRLPRPRGGLSPRWRLPGRASTTSPTWSRCSRFLTGRLNLAPAQTYEHIVAKHPDSALAPLAPS
jgi:hypothetical protein